MRFTAICQSNQQVLWLLHNSEYSKKISCWIAANPSAYWELRKHNIPFSTLDEILVNKSPEHIESLQREQVRWAQNVDKTLKVKIPNFESVDFCPAQNYLYYLKNTWDTIINRADLLESVTDIIYSDNLIYFQNPSTIHFGEDLTLAGSVLSECIPIWANYHDIQLTPLSALPGDTVWQPQVQTRPGICQRIRSIIPKSIFTEIESLHNEPGMHLAHFISAFRLLSSRAGNGTIIIRTAYDQTPDFSTHLKKNGYNPFSFNVAVRRGCRYAGSHPSIDPALAEVWQDLTKLEWFWNPGGWQNWSLRTVLQPLFYHFWHGILPKLWGSFSQSRRYIQKQRPCALCVPSIWGPDETGFVMAVHNERVPVIFYQHGACMGDIENSIWDLTDSCYGDFQLVYGEGAARYIRSRDPAILPRPVPIPVGSARLDRISSGISDKRKNAIRKRILGKNDVPLVVYIPGVMFNNFFRYTHQNLRDCKIFETRNRMAEVFHDHPEFHFVFKSFISQGHDPTREMLNVTCPECSIIDSIPLTELQWAADFLIHEIPCTGMFEGLVTDKPMIVYIDSKIYTMHQHVKRVLRKRAMVAETAPDFIDQVSQFFDKGNFSPVPSPDREFIREFCTHLDDGQSALRAANVIEDIIQKGKSRPMS